MIKVKPLKQTKSYCGPYALKMVFDYYGKNISIKEIAKEAKTAIAFGTGPKKMVNAAKFFGFNAVYKEKFSINELSKLVNKKKIPVIVNWFSENDGHYSVLVGINKTEIYLQDPEIGKIRKIKVKDFLKVWFDFSGDYLKSKKDIRIRPIILILKN
jgi:ABC-type bacteriocin/lantibiotic exporter with double-glycine peptidase domain